MALVDTAKTDKAKNGQQYTGLKGLPRRFILLAPPEVSCATAFSCFRTLAAALCGFSAFDMSETCHGLAPVGFYSRPAHYLLR